MASDSKMRTLQGSKGYMIDSPSRMLPSFSLTAKDLPEIKNWSVGKKYKLEIEVEQVSMAKDEYMQDQPLTARFRILKIKSETEDEETKKAKKGYE